MRLLQRLSGSAGFSLVEKFGGDVPPYAILSHTWGSDEDEVTFSDLRHGRAKHVLGYSKLVFCSEQAATDNLGFFWVDTCCIDKNSSNELSEAINSMFKWYRNARKCYVLLSDVAADGSLEDMSQQQWARLLRNSRWFQRGWTLQEMLAPEVVEFFAKDGRLLGNKTTLLQALHYRTQIPISALQGSPLSRYSIDERISWMKNRQTKREEDAAYSLLGLLGIHMTLLYGEGRDRALMRLRRKAERLLKNGGLAKPLASRAWSVPFQRNEEFIDRHCLNEVFQICCQPAGCATLLGPAGVGKTQVAIEYIYRVREQTPARWVFWINAATRASFEEDYRAIAEATKMTQWENPRVDLLPLVSNWLRDESNGHWTIVVDNANHGDVFFSYGRSPDHATATSIPPLRVLSNFLPQVPHGSILIASRDQDVARRFRSINNKNTTVEVGSITTDEAMAILGNRLGSVTYRDEALRLLNVLHSTPLAIAHATTLMGRNTDTNSTYSNATRSSASSQTFALEHSEHTALQIIRADFSHRDIGSELANIVHRLTTTVEDLYKILPAVRAIQSRQNPPNVPSSETRSTRHTIESEHHSATAYLPEVHSTRPATQSEHTSLEGSPTRSTPDSGGFLGQQRSDVSFVAGTSGLIQRSSFIPDTTMDIDQGRRSDNSIATGQDDPDLFEALGEDRTAVLKWGGLVDAREMERRWPTIGFVHQDGMDSFTWVMVAITSALDECLPSTEIQELLIRVFVEVLGRDDDVAVMLRTCIKSNIELWRSFGSARDIAHSIKKEMRHSLSGVVSNAPPNSGIPQLNAEEKADTKNMLVWLLNGVGTVFITMCPITFSIAEAWRKVKLDLCTDGKPIYECQACVMYHPDLIIEDID